MNLLKVSPCQLADNNLSGTQHTIWYRRSSSCASKDTRASSDKGLGENIYRLAFCAGLRCATANISRRCTSLEWTLDRRRRSVGHELCCIFHSRTPNIFQVAGRLDKCRLSWKRCFVIVTRCSSFSPSWKFEGSLERSQMVAQASPQMISDVMAVISLVSSTLRCFVSQASDVNARKLQIAALTVPFKLRAWRVEKEVFASNDEHFFRSSCWRCFLELPVCWVVKNSVDVDHRKTFISGSRCWRRTITKGKIFREYSLANALTFSSTSRRTLQICWHRRA